MNHQPRSLKLDLTALLLLALVLFLGCALLTYDPADPTTGALWPMKLMVPADALVYPSNEVVSNACGKMGAITASVLFHYLGLGAYFTLLSLGVLDLLLLRRAEIGTPLLRTIGWTLSLIALTTLSALLVPTLSPGPAVGSGGYLGLLGKGLLEQHFAFTGSLILSISLLLVGLLLTTDYLLLTLTQGILSLTGHGLKRSGKILIEKHRARQAAALAAEQADEEEDPLLAEHAFELDEYEEEEDLEEAEEELSIRVGGKKSQEGEEDLEEDGLEEEYETAEAEEEIADEEELPEEEEAAEVAEEVSAAQKPAKKKRSLLPQWKKRKDKQQQAQEKIDREEVMEQLDAASEDEKTVDYELPAIELLTPGEEYAYDAHEKEVRRKAKILEKTFANFGFKVRVGRDRNRSGHRAI